MALVLIPPDLLCGGRALDTGHQRGIRTSCHHWDKLFVHIFTNLGKKEGERILVVKQIFTMSKPNSTFSEDDKIARNKPYCFALNGKSWYLQNALRTNKERSSLLFDQTKTASLHQCEVPQPRQDGQCWFDNCLPALKTILYLTSNFRMRWHRFWPQRGPMIPTVFTISIPRIFSIWRDNCSLLDQHFSALWALLGTFVTLGTFFTLGTFLAFPCMISLANWALSSSKTFKQKSAQHFLSLWT